MQFMQIYTTNKQSLPPPDQSLGPSLRVPRKTRNLERTENGSLVMSEANLRQICEMEGLYEYPEMNKKIYLHYKVIEAICGLDKYVGLKSLYLQNNVITKIEGLDQLTQLENLFLQNNMIKRIEGMERLRDLRILNLSNNNIFAIEGLQTLLQLQNLTLSKNYLSTFESLEGLGQSSATLTSIDLSENKVDADERLFDLIPQVKCLYISGNPFAKNILHYRRTVIGKLPQLLYLDQRAVDREERILAEAWVKGGEVGWKSAREQILKYRKQKKQERRDEIMKNIDVHRKNKINVFQSNIHDAELEIGKLQRYKSEPENVNQVYFYEVRIAQLIEKIRDNQQFIDSIYTRMGIAPLPPISSVAMPIPSVPADIQEGMFDIQEEDEGPSEGQNDGESSEGQKSSNGESQESNIVSSSSEQSSLKTYYSLEELD